MVNMTQFDKLKDHLPEIGKIIATFPEHLQEKVFDTLVSELLEKTREVSLQDQGKINIIEKGQVEDELSLIATVDPDGMYHSTIRDLKASSAKDAAKRLVYVLIRSYTKMMNSPSVSRKEIIYPELVRWRLANGNTRGFIANDRGIIKNDDQLSLDNHAQKEADQFIEDIGNLEKRGSWKPGTVKRQRRLKDESKSNNLNSKSLDISEQGESTSFSDPNPPKHTLEELKNTSTIAQIINVKTGPQLILAAAIKFSIVDGKETFTRKEILKEMQTASTYYSSSFNNNATKYLTNLVKSGKLRENMPDLYSLSADTKRELEQKLGIK